MRNIYRESLFAGLKHQITDLDILIENIESAKRIKFEPLTGDIRRMYPDPADIIDATIIFQSLQRYVKELERVLKDNNLLLNTLHFKGD